MTSQHRTHYDLLTQAGCGSIAPYLVHALETDGEVYASRELLSRFKSRWYDMGNDEQDIDNFLGNLAYNYPFIVQPWKLKNICKRRLCSLQNTQLILEFYSCCPQHNPLQYDFPYIRDSYKDPIRVLLKKWHDRVSTDYWKAYGEAKGELDPFWRASCSDDPAFYQDCNRIRDIWCEAVEDAFKEWTVHPCMLEGAKAKLGETKKLEGVIMGAMEESDSS